MALTTLASAGAAIFGGYLYKKAPKWQKKRVNAILREHGKKLSLISEAELELLMAASYGKYNPFGYIGPARALFFTWAVEDMPLDEELSNDLWPVLYHLYYGKRKPLRKEQRALKKIYDDARASMRMFGV